MHRLVLLLRLVTKKITLNTQIIQPPKSIFNNPFLTFGRMQDMTTRTHNQQAGRSGPFALYGLTHMFQRRTNNSLIRT